METHISPNELKDPRLREAGDILRRCVHCGLCTATCPTYLLLGDERDSPRGRIYLIKAMLEGDASPEDVRPHLDRCLSCYSCMTTCPSGVDYAHLSGFARVRINAAVKRRPLDSFFRRLLSAVLPSAGRFRLALTLAPLARPLAPLLKGGLKPLAAMLRLAPSRLPPPAIFSAGQTIKTTQPRRGRVALMRGCAQQVIAPQINDASVRVLNRFGFDVVLAQGEGCCGSLVLHLGEEEQAKAAARRNIDVWLGLRKDGPLDAIIINASGCGTTVKDYAHLFAHDLEYAAKAKFVSSIAKDICEFLAAQRPEPPVGWSDLRVAYHSACSLQHGQRLDGPPRELLGKAGFTVVEIPEGHICCGSAGTYNMLEPDLSAKLKARKLAHIASAHSDCVATGNVGCLTQLSGAGIPVVHTIELLDWALGGPCPKPLAHLSHRFRPLLEAPGDAPQNALAVP